MERPSVDSASRRPADHHGRRGIPQVMPLGHEIRNLIERTDDEVDELHLRDRPQSQVAHPARRADHGALSDRRVPHALPAKPFQQTFTGLESASIHTYILSEQNHRRVAFHLFKHRLLDGFEKSDLRTVGRSAIRSGPVCFGHGYLRAFLEALAVLALTVFFGAVFAAIFTADFPPLTDSFPAACCAGCVSPKGIGAFAPPEPLPD